MCAIKNAKTPRVRAKHSIILLCLLVISCIAAQPATVSVSLEPQTLALSPGGEGRVSLVMSTGAQTVYAGEFNLTYTPGAVNVTVEGTADWTVSPAPRGPRRYIYYRNPGASISDRSVVATILVRALPGATSASVRVEYFKAADKDGNDLTVSLTNSQVSVTISGEGAGEAGWQPPPSRPKGIDTGTLLWVALGAALLLAGVFAVYQVYMQPTFYLLIDGRPLKLRGSRVVIGREDLAGLLAPGRAAYVSRRARGGHFQIIRQRGAYYIQDLGSTNGTYVNEVDIRGRGFVQLRNGDVISVPGAFQAVFRVG